MHEKSPAMSSSSSDSIKITNDQLSCIISKIIIPANNNEHKLCDEAENTSLTNNKLFTTNIRIISSNFIRKATRSDKQYSHQSYVIIRTN